eukprot:9915887-Ditylum_brightwellii.AAC.1
MASIMSPSTVNGTNFQWPVWGHLTCSSAWALFSQYSFPFVAQVSSGGQDKRDSLRITSEVVLA